MTRKKYIHTEEHKKNISRAHLEYWEKVRAGKIKRITKKYERFNKKEN
jgi:hypothetical protein